MGKRADPAKETQRRRKISATKKGRSNQKISEALKDRPNPKVSLALKGRKHPEGCTCGVHNNRGKVGLGMNSGEKKVVVLTHYGGGKCACVRCGFDDVRALTIDHINGRTKGDKRGGAHFYTYLIMNDYPLGYQTLCFNCQWIKKAEKGENKGYRDRASLENLC